MGKGLHYGRWLHPQYIQRYLFGTWSVGFIANFYATWLYGVPREQDANIKWGWWLQEMQMRRDGTLPADMPGYMRTKWLNDAEKTWMVKHPKYEQWKEQGLVLAEDCLE